VKQVDNTNEKKTKPAQSTLRDVAMAANVSEMTVSRVLRNTGSVAEKTRDKVLKIVDQLGFVPNQIAGSLATSTSNLIAVIIPSLRNQVFTEVLSGITDHLESNGFKAVIGISEYDLDREEALIRSMLSWRPSGLVVSNMAHTQSTRKILKQAGIPVVQIMEIEQDAVDSCVGVDHVKAGALMAQHFLQRGYRRIGYIGCSNRDLTAAKRFQGFRQVLVENNMDVEGIVEFDEPVGVQRGKKGLMRLLSDHPQLDAVYFPNDIAAIGGYFHCLGANIDVPTQLAIGGFSGLEIGQLMPVPLTTVKINRFEIGRLSAGIIVDRLNDKHPKRINTVDIQLIKAETT